MGREAEGPDEKDVGATPFEGERVDVSRSRDNNTFMGQVLVRAPPRLFRALFCLLIRLFRALPNT